jgi:phospholipid transport system substrate-binding protein
MKKLLLYAVIYLLILPQGVMADDKEDALKLVKSSLDDLISVLRNKETSTEVKNREVLKIIDPIFDYALIAKLSLGKKHWTRLSKAQRKEFTDLFIERLKASYLDKLSLYTDEIFEYHEPILVKKKIHIPTELVSKDNRLATLYKLYKSRNGWKVYDLEIQGVSVISTYRSQFDELLGKGSVDDLLSKMQQPEIPEKPLTKPSTASSTAPGK